MSDYIPTIGLEIHAELVTMSKMFCSCRNDPDEDRPNIHICPICLGHPGTLPVINKEAVRKVLQLGLSVDGRLADFTEWDRKNYFYPDIPKGYQISQYAFPLISGGKLVDVEIERIHLEEDTAQSTHDKADESLVNFNRAGVPLMELVTKPVIRDAETAVGFARELQLLLRYLKTAEASMEKGQMRIEANISVAPAGSRSFGTKTEVKNLNSFRSLERAIEFEIGRQSAVLDRGEKVAQETRGWDERTGQTYSQRSKESSHDYRYFPEPDIPKFKISIVDEFDPKHLREGLPELPEAKRMRLTASYGLNPKESSLLIESPAIADYLDAVTKNWNGDAKKTRLAVNYILSDYLGILKRGNEVPEFKIDSISPSRFAELIDLIVDGAVSSRAAKELLPLLLEDRNSSPRTLAEKHGLIQKSDSSDLSPVIDKVIADNAKVVAEYKSGKTASLQYLIGQAMKATRGGNPEIVRKLLIEKLD